MFIATAPACSLDRFIVQADSLPLPGAAHMALQRVCFDPAAFTPACYDAAGMVLPASLQRAVPKRLGGVSGRPVGGAPALAPLWSGPAAGEHRGSPRTLLACGV